MIVTQIVNVSLPGAAHKIWGLTGVKGPNVLERADNQLMSLQVLER